MSMIPECAHSNVSKNKSVFVSKRGLTSAQWSEYSENTKHVKCSSVFTSTITAETVTVDGFALSQKDTAGITATATRPLAIQKDGSWFSAPARLAKHGFRSQVCSRLGGWLLKPHPAYGWDLTKNICELYGPSGYIRTAYTYAPYGEVTAEGDVTQPIQWSSEHCDEETLLSYYNYRYYNSLNGRWNEQELNSLQNSRMHKNLYSYIENMPIFDADYLGLLSSGVLSASGTSQAISFPGYKGMDQQEETNSAYNSDPVIGKSICDRYMEKTSKCCRNSLLVDDPYLPEARTVCKRFLICIRVTESFLIKFYVSRNA